MTNLIYINEENFREKHLFSKIKFLLYEMTIYFDGSKELRMLGFNIALKIFNDQNIQIYKTVLIIKKYFALVFRISILLTTVFVGFCFLGKNINFLGQVVFLLSVMIGFLMFAFLFPKYELDSIDNSLKMLVDSQKNHFKVDGKDSEMRVQSANFDTAYIDQREHLLKKEKDIERNNLLFLGFPVEIISKLLEPLKNGTLGDKLKITQSEYVCFLHNIIYDNDLDPFVIPRKKGEFFRTYFYCIYELLDEIRFNYPVSCWNKKIFFDRLKKTVANYQNLDEKSLRVHDNKTDFSKKTKEYLRSLILLK